MFEEEAEEYETNAECVEIDDYGHKVYGSPHIEEAYQKGAEFGYNKANEWHKVADGDIPKNERWVCNQDGCYCYYDIDTEQWLDTEGTRTRTIEWCDMPTKESK